MVINGKDLLRLRPIVGMLESKQTAHGVSHGLSEAGYDIRIKQEIQFCGIDNVRRFVISTDRNADGSMKSYHRQGGNFTIASTVEEFDMPCELMGIVHDKSTWARQGLSVFNTVIEPGWNGFLTLELFYRGNGNLTIPAGAGIAQVIFHRVSRPAIYNGKYQGQANEPVAAIASV
jgi:dCTP deaminase